MSSSNSLRKYDSKNPNGFSALLFYLFIYNFFVVRGSHQMCSLKIGVPKILQNSQENTCARAFFWIGSRFQVWSLRFATLLRKRLRHRRSPVNYVKFLRTHFLQNTSGWLFLCCEDLGRNPPEDRGYSEDMCYQIRQQLVLTRGRNQLKRSKTI